MTACISRTFMWHDLWDADHRPVSSVNLTGSPAQTGRICAESYSRLLGDEGRPCKTAGDDHQAISDRPTVELESGRTSSRSSGTMLWRPTIGLDEDGAVPVEPARSWTPACREACADLWQLCSDWPSSADELTGPLDASSVGRHLWNVKCWTASQWTGSLDFEWYGTSRSWWSSQETGAPWWLSGRAVEPVPEYLPWLASRLSRRVASHLAA